MFIADQIAELQSNLDNLQAQFSDQEAEANEAIAKWQESCEALDATNSDLSQSLEAARNEKIEADKTIESIQNQLREVGSDLVEAKAKLELDEHALKERQGK